MSNKKTHLAVFQTCVFRVYLRNHLSYKKVISIYLHPRLKRFQKVPEIYVKTQAAKTARCVFLLLIVCYNPNEFLSADRSCTTKKIL